MHDRHVDLRVYLVLRRAGWDYRVELRAHSYWLLLRLTSKVKADFRQLLFVLVLCTQVVYILIRRDFFKSEELSLLDGTLLAVVFLGCVTNLVLACLILSHNLIVHIFGLGVVDHLHLKVMQHLRVL